MSSSDSRIPMSDMAPEVDLQAVGHGCPADVYSFGLLLWQLCSKEKPFSDIRTPLEFDQIVFIGGARPALDPRRWSGPVCALVEHCWETAPERRPIMTDVKSTLNGILQNFSEPVAVKSRDRSNLGRLSVSLIHPRAGYLDLVKKN